MHHFPVAADASFIAIVYANKKTGFNILGKGYATGEEKGQETNDVFHLDILG